MADGQGMAFRLQPPPQGQRLFAIGNTGTGKTTLLRAMFRGVEHGIAIDTKQDPDEHLESDGVLVLGDDIYDVADGRYVWRPDLNAFDEYEADKFFRWALEVGNRFLLVHEMGDVTDSGSRYPVWLRRCFTRGRSQHLTMAWTTQEAVRVPRFCYGQSEHRYVFWLGMPDQCALAEEYIGSEIPWDALIPQYDASGKTMGGAFMYRNPYGQVQGPYKQSKPAFLEAPKAA